jgi:ATP-binding cassette subfamily E protein 1
LHKINAIGQAPGGGHPIALGIGQPTWIQAGANRRVWKKTSDFKDVHYISDIRGFEASPKPPRHIDMSLQSKKSFASLDYTRCDPSRCDPVEGLCAAVPACSHKLIKQLDGPFTSPVIFQDMCMGCWDCIEACPLDAISATHIGS